MKTSDLKNFLLYSIIALFFLFKQTHACDTPVYRYALENWQPDLYHVYVFYQGQLTEPEKQLVDNLNKNSVQYGGYANYSLRTVNFDKISLENNVLTESIGKSTLPVIAVCYPGIQQSKASIWQKPLNESHVKEIVSSPLCTKISNELSYGKTAIWLMLKSGNFEKDNKAQQILEKELGLLYNSINENPTQSTKTDTLKTDYSLILLGQKQANESLLEAMLLYSENDLINYTDYPMVFIIFGQGRLLYTLVGDGITKRNIKEAHSILTGPCTCEIKEYNTGLDLLFNQNWSAIKKISSPNLYQPLSGIKKDSTYQSQNTELITSVKDIDDSLKESTLYRNMMMIIVILFSLTLVTGVFIALKRKNTL